MIRRRSCAQRKIFSTAFLLVACALTAPALLAQQGIPSDSIWKWTYLGEAQISPDGGRITYVRIRACKKKGTHTSIPILLVSLRA